MDLLIGKVKEVFIPNDDIINSDKIGFKILVDGELLTIIQQQNEVNCNILRDDLVIIRKQNISSKEFIDIELYEGEDCE